MIDVHTHASVSFIRDWASGHANRSVFRWPFFLFANWITHMRRIKMKIIQAPRIVRVCAQTRVLSRSTTDPLSRCIHEYKVYFSFLQTLDEAWEKGLVRKIRQTNKETNWRLSHICVHPLSEFTNFADGDPRGPFDAWRAWNYYERQETSVPPSATVLSFPWNGECSVIIVSIESSYLGGDGEEKLARCVFL